MERREARCRVVNDEGYPCGVPLDLRNPHRQTCGHNAYIGEGVDASLSCANCFQLLRVEKGARSLRTKCGAFFYDAACCSADVGCPSCGSDDCAGEEGLKSVPGEIFARIGMLKIECLAQRDGCSWVGPLREMATHFKAEHLAAEEHSASPLAVRFEEALTTRLRHRRSMGLVELSRTVIPPPLLRCSLLEFLEARPDVFEIAPSDSDGLPVVRLVNAALLRYGSTISLPASSPSARESIEEPTVSVPRHKKQLSLQPEKEERESSASSTSSTSTYSSYTSGAREERCKKSGSSTFRRFSPGAVFRTTPVEPQGNFPDGRVVQGTIADASARRSQRSPSPQPAQRRIISPTGLGLPSPTLSPAMSATRGEGRVVRLEPATLHPNAPRQSRPGSPVSPTAPLVGHRSVRSLTGEHLDSSQPTLTAHVRTPRGRSISLETPRVLLDGVAPAAAGNTASGPLPPVPAALEKRASFQTRATHALFATDVEQGSGSGVVFSFGSDAAARNGAGEHGANGLGVDHRPTVLIPETPGVTVASVDDGSAGRSRGWSDVSGVSGLSGVSGAAAGAPASVASSRTGEKSSTRPRSVGTPKEGKRGSGSSSGSAPCNITPVVARRLPRGKRVVSNLEQQEIARDYGIRVIRHMRANGGGSEPVLLRMLGDVIRFPKDALHCQTQDFFDNLPSIFKVHGRSTADVAISLVKHQGDVEGRFCALKVVYIPPPIEPRRAKPGRNRPLSPEGRMRLADQYAQACKAFLVQETRAVPLKELCSRLGAFPKQLQMKPQEFFLQNSAMFVLHNPHTPTVAVSLRTVPDLSEPPVPATPHFIKERAGASSEQTQQIRALERELEETMRHTVASLDIILRGLVPKFGTPFQQTIRDEWDKQLDHYHNAKYEEAAGCVRAIVSSASSGLLLFVRGPGEVPEFPALLEELSQYLRRPRDADLFAYIAHHGGPDGEAPASHSAASLLRLMFSLFLVLDVIAAEFRRSHLKRPQRSSPSPQDAPAPAAAPAEPRPPTPTRAVNVAAPTSDVRETICKYFAAGRCKFGARCMFKHT